MVHALFVLLAFVGFAYGAYAVFALGWGGVVAEQSEREQERDWDAKARSGGRKPMPRFFKLVHWFVVLPVRRPGAALFVAVLLALPALLI